MAKLHLREYLLTHSFAELELEHGVLARPNSRHDKFSCNYDQLMAKNGDPLADQCRGLIIRPWQPLERVLIAMNSGGEQKHGIEPRIVGGFDVLAWPMNRFYNLGQGGAAEIDWSAPDLRILEKIDGTCCIVYWDPLHGQWHVATRAVPEADLPINYNHDIRLPDIGIITFADLFKIGIENTTRLPYDDFMGRLDKTCTYVFELTSPYNKVVIEYPETKVTLLAVRSTAPGEELDPRAHNLELGLGLPMPAFYGGSMNLDALVIDINSHEGSKFEGVVAVHGYNLPGGPRRNKIKNANYMLASRMSDALRVSRYSVLEMILRDTHDDVLAQLNGDVRSKMELMVANVADYFRKIDASFHELKARHGMDRRGFAMDVQKLGDFQGVYFGLFEGRAPNASGWFKDQASKGKISRGALDYILKKVGG